MVWGKLLPKEAITANNGKEATKPQTDSTAKFYYLCYVVYINFEVLAVYVMIKIEKFICTFETCIVAS